MWFYRHGLLCVGRRGQSLYVYALKQMTEAGVYIDLIRNPERFTGYSGDSAWKIWKAIYEQNCFKFIYGAEQSQAFKSIEVNKESLCVEKRAFYKVVSGLHTSISIHLCYEHLNKDTGVWVTEWSPILKLGTKSWMLYVTRRGTPRTIGKLVFSLHFDAWSCFGAWHLFGHLYLVHRQ